MISKAIIIFAALAAVCLAGSCAALFPVKKEAPKESSVKEEDIGDARGVGAAGPAGHEEMGAVYPPTSRSDQPAPSVNDGGEKRPRRIIWRDRKGKGERSWENADQPDQGR
jgi:hypothetical protein